MELGGFRTPAMLGLDGGLLKDVVVVVFAAEVEVGLDKVDVRGATGLVNGRLGGMLDLVSSPARLDSRSAMLNYPQKRSIEGMQNRWRG